MSFSRGRGTESMLSHIGSEIECAALLRTIPIPAPVRKRSSHGQLTLQKSFCACDTGPCPVSAHFLAISHAAPTAVFHHPPPTAEHTVNIVNIMANLLDLPPELRIIIYRYYCDDLIPSIKSVKAWIRLPPLYCTNKQIKREFVGVSRFRTVVRT